MKRIVLLGANGQLGTDICKTLSDTDLYELITVSRSELDVENWQEVGTVLSALAPFDYLINCTAYHRTDECENHAWKAFAVNTLSPREMALACARQGSGFFHFSTDYVFDGLKTEPYQEHDRPAPLNVYGISKLAGEHSVLACHDRTFLIRVSSLFGEAGASGKGGNFVETMIRLASTGTPLRVVNDQVMSPTHTLDIARAVKCFLDTQVGCYGIYHCSGTGYCSWYEFTCEIFRQMNLDVAVSPVSSDFTGKAKRPRFSTLDNGKLAPIHQMPHWKDALREYLVLKQHIRQRG